VRSFIIFHPCKAHQILDFIQIYSSPTSSICDFAFERTNPDFYLVVAHSVNQIRKASEHENREILNARYPFESKDHSKWETGYGIF